MACIFPVSAFHKVDNQRSEHCRNPGSDGLDRFPLSDYANQRFIPNVSSLSPQVIAFCRDILRGDKAAAVDTRVIASIAELAQSASKKIDVQVARDVRLSDLYTDDNFIFLGSPRSNLWTTLFNDRLDFRFVFDSKSQQESFAMCILSQASPPLTCRRRRVGPQVNHLRRLVLCRTRARMDRF